MNKEQRAARTKLEMEAGRRAVEALQMQDIAAAQLENMLPFMKGKSWNIYYKVADKTFETRFWVREYGDMKLTDPVDKFPSQETIATLTLLFK